MKLITFQRSEGAAAPGLLVSESIYDLSSAGFGSALEFIEGGEQALAAAAALLKSGAATIPLNAVRLLAPIAKPPRIFGIGLNYAEHAAESRMDVQAVPTVFLKLASSVTGPETDIILPKNATQPDYEAELAVVIGRPGYRIAATSSVTPS